jgi:hypothetical protein
MAMAHFIAREFLKVREIIDGLTVMRGKGLMTEAELIDVGHAALDLIKEGKVR